ncbi:hypothetical protein ESA94_08765 [Lacibacter luteus]|uniref:Universal stress protein n=1 Tax=Lacibacter luteus TaxID=2508719 RepID=A0A4Q1CIU7_9BACT|nr:hypothetical protein [Lacibacter luteus]RXK60550.1 hypothetical protein ESA94_08765 [Lacibacter luteus]
MEKTVVIPTDFSIASLNIVKSYVSMQPANARLNIILLHGLHQSDSIRSLLFYSKHRMMEELCSKEFKEACYVLKNKFASQIKTMKSDLFSGFTQSAFNQYTEANNIAEVCLPVLYNPKFKNKNSFDLLPYIKASKLPVEMVGSEVDVPMPEKGKVAELFFNRVSVS